MARPAPSYTIVTVSDGADQSLFVNGRKLDLVAAAEILAITVEDELDWQKTRGSWTTATR